MTEERLFTFNLTVGEIGILIGSMSREKIPIRKELYKEIDEQIYSEKRKKKK